MATFTNQTRSSSSFSNQNKSTSVEPFRLLIDNTFLFLIDNSSMFLIGGGVVGPSDWDNLVKH